MRRPGSARSSPTTWSRRGGRPSRAGTTRGLRPYGPLSLDPATHIFHYGQSIFEGFKAYTQPDGGIATFRPEANGERFTRSAARLALPELPVEDFVSAADLLVRQDAAWVPAGGETSLYLRPFMMATEVGLGVRPAQDVTVPGHRVAGRARTSPRAAASSRCGSPRTTPGRRPAAPVPRSAPATTPRACCRSRRRSTTAASRCSSSTPSSSRWVEEIGGMNLWFVLDDGTLVTPELTGTILEGVTRDTMKMLAAGPRPSGRGAPDRHRRVAQGRRRRAHHRGVRLRDRGRRHLDRRVALARRRAHAADRDAGRRGPAIGAGRRAARSRRGPPRGCTACHDRGRVAGREGRSPCGVRDAMSTVVLTIGPTHTLRDAARQMSVRKIGAAVVMDPDRAQPGHHHRARRPRRGRRGAGRRTRAGQRPPDRGHRRRLAGVVARRRGGRDGLGGLPAPGGVRGPRGRGDAVGP